MCLTTVLTSAERNGTVHCEDKPSRERPSSLHIFPVATLGSSFGAGRKDFAHFLMPREEQVSVSSSAQDYFSCWTSKWKGSSDGQES